MDLNDYVEQNPARRFACDVCDLDEGLQKQLVIARLERKPSVSYETISQWLETQGVTVSRETIRKHFIRRHYE